MFSDVTELKRDSALFNRVQALAHIGGWEWDCTSDRLYLTDESARILAQDVPPVTMPGMVDCLAPGDRLRMRAALDHVIREGRDFDLELQGRSEEHTSELQSLMRISYAVF